MINKPKSVTKTHPSQNTEHQTLSEEYKSNAEKIKNAEHKKEKPLRAGFMMATALRSLGEDGQS